MNEYEYPPHRHEHDFRKIGELFARVQDFLTKPELAIYSQHTVNPPYTSNIEAYNLFLQGRYLFYQGGIQAWPRAIEFYQKAVAVDPNYVDAFAGMAVVYDLMGVFTELRSLKHRELADKALDRALLLNPDHSEALTGKAIRFLLETKDWQQAETLFKAAQRGVGDRTQAYLVYVNSLLLPTRRVNEAQAILEMLESNDPLNARIKMNYGAMLIFNYLEIEKGIAKLKEAFALDPRLPVTSYLLIKAYLQSAAVADAEKQFAHLVTLLPPTNMLRLEAQGMLQLAIGDPKAARATLARMILLAPESGGPYSPIGALAIALGKPEEGTTWLEKAAESSEFSSLMISAYRNHPMLREYPPFQALLNKMQLDDESLREMGYVE